MEHLAKLDLLHGAKNTFHQNNPLGSAMDVMDVSIIAAETAFAPKELNILWLCLWIAHLPNYETASIRHHLQGTEKASVGARRRARSLLDGRGRSSSQEEVLIHFIYSFKANLLSALPVPASPGDSEVSETGPCPTMTKADCGRMNRQVLQDRGILTGDGAGAGGEHP